MLLTKSAKGTPCCSGFRTWFIDRLGQPQVDDFRCHSASFLYAHHDIGLMSR